LGIDISVRLGKGRFKHNHQLFAVARRTQCLLVFSEIVVVEVVEGGSVAEVGDALNGAPTPTKRKEDATEGKVMCE
jgi:hypothetical protein